MTESEVYAQIPDGAVWTASFGLPTASGFNEAYRDTDGTKYWISNGPHNPLNRLNWSITKKEASK